MAYFSSSPSSTTELHLSSRVCLINKTNFRIHFQLLTHRLSPRASGSNSILYEASVGAFDQVSNPLALEHCTGIKIRGDEYGSWSNLIDIPPAAPPLAPSSVSYALEVDKLPICLQVSNTTQMTEAIFLPPQYIHNHLPFPINCIRPFSSSSSASLRETIPSQMSVAMYLNIADTFELELDGCVSQAVSIPSSLLDVRIGGVSIRMLPHREVNGSLTLHVFSPTVFFNHCSSVGLVIKHKDRILPLVLRGSYHDQPVLSGLEEGESIQIAVEGSNRASLSELVTIHPQSKSLLEIQCFDVRLQLACSITKESYSTTVHFFPQTFINNTCPSDLFLRSCIATNKDIANIKVSPNQSDTWHPSAASKSNLGTFLSPLPMSVIVITIHFPF